LARAAEVDMVVKVKAQPRKKATLQRYIRLLRAPAQLGVGLMSITKDRQTNYYVFREIPCEIGGRAFALHRLGLGNLYHVRVGKPEECSCECMGFLHHRKCKHVLGLLALTGHELL
jgi:hypothetical protein